MGCIFLVLQGKAEEYTAQVGDTITITVREREWLSGKVVMDANGQITLPKPMGSVKVLGLTVDQITELLTERLKEYIVEPTVFVSLSPSLSFTVHITGEVQAPNAFQVMNGTSLQEAITKAGGFTPLANKKQLKIIRKDMTQGGIVWQPIIDFTQFLENGAVDGNPLLKAFDVVLVPRLPKSERMLTVIVLGAVRNPGALSIEGPLLLVEVLARAGGSSINADLTHVSILSREGDRYAWKPLNFESFLTGVELSANPMVSGGEVVFVPEQPSVGRSFTVNVTGQVNKPGAYPVDKNGRLFDAIYAAGGFAEDSAMDEVTIIRASNPHPQMIKINAQNYLITGDLKYNPLLEAGDTIFIPIPEKITKSIPGIQTAFFESLPVTIIGEVKQANTYRVSKAFTVLDVLNLAGGLTQNADLKRIVIIRENEKPLPIDLEKVLQKGELQLLPSLQRDDTIFVPKNQEKRSLWKTVVRSALDISTIVTAFLLIERRIGY